MLTFSKITRNWLYKTEYYYDKNPHDEYIQYLKQINITSNPENNYKPRKYNLYNIPSMGCIKVISIRYKFSFPSIEDNSKYSLYKQELIPGVQEYHLNKKIDVMTEYLNIFTPLEDSNKEILYFIVKGSTPIKIFYKYSDIIRDYKPSPQKNE